MTLNEARLMRRVAGHHDVRLDGVYDLILRAREATVLDVGSNRGLVGYEFFCNGASLIHGVDNYADGVAFSRQLFADQRNVTARFELVDLTEGPDALIAAFGDEYRDRYDIVLLFATYHKLKRVMRTDDLNKLTRHLGKRVGTYLAWSGYAIEAPELDRLLEPVGLKRIHYSEIATRDRGAAEAAGIWRRATEPE